MCIRKMLERRQDAALLHTPSTPLFQVKLLNQDESIFLQSAQRVKYDTRLCNDQQGQNGTRDRSLGCG